MSIAIVGGVVVISLAIILVIVPLLMGVYACSEAEVLGQKWKFCPEKAPALVSAAATDAGAGDVDARAGDFMPILPSPPRPSLDTTVINEEANELINTSNRTNLNSINSIAGDWNFTGQTFNKLANMSGTIKFGQDNEFSSRFYLNGFLQPVQYGTYTYSPSESTLIITYFGNNPTTYNIDKMSEDSFNTKSSTPWIFYLKK